MRRRQFWHFLINVLFAYENWIFNGLSDSRQLHSFITNGKRKGYNIFYRKYNFLLFTVFIFCCRRRMFKKSIMLLCLSGNQKVYSTRFLSKNIKLLLLLTFFECGWWVWPLFLIFHPRSDTNPLQHLRLVWMAWVIWSER